MKPNIKRSLLTAIFVAAGVGMTTSLPLPALAAANDQVAYQAKKLTAPQMLAKQQQAVAFILKSYKAIDKTKRGKSAPFLKSLSAVAKSIETVKKAAEAKDGKTFANNLPILAQNIATLNQTYKMSKLKDKKVATGVKTLNKMWDLYLKQVMGGKAQDPAAMATKNNRRIHEMDKRLDKMSKDSKITARQKKEIERLRKLLAKAKANNKKPQRQWYTSYILADFAGYYAGYYYWAAAYDKSGYGYWQSGWEYFSHECSYSYSETSSYYESYSFESYESTSIETSESYDFEYSAEEYSSFDSEYEASEDTLDEATEDEYEATDEDDEIEAAEDYDDPNEEPDDAADDPDPEADADDDLDAEEADDGNDDNDDDFLDEGDEDADGDGIDDDVDDGDDGDDGADDGDDGDDGADDGDDGADDGDDGADDGDDGGDE